MLKFLGKYWAKQILRQQKNHQLQQQQLLLSLGNGIKYLLTDQERVKATSTYKRCAHIISLLSPMDLKGSEYIRLGKDYDGGYIMVDYFQNTQIEAAYSFGIDNDVSWEEDIARHGIDIFMYDHTIKRLPGLNSKFHYFKMGVTGDKKAANLRTLSEFIARNNHTTCQNLILKMDIEGCEWDVLTETPSSMINKFSQFVIEFHGLKPDMDNLKLDVLNKLNQAHQIVHVHANSLSIPQWIGDLVLPEALEVTYVRRADFKDKFAINTRQFPTELDQPSSPDFPDIYLGNFSIQK